MALCADQVGGPYDRDRRPRYFAVAVQKINSTALDRPRDQHLLSIIQFVTKIEKFNH